MRLPTCTAAAAFVFATICTSPMRAQQDLDSTKADPVHHKVEFENDQVRVVRFRLAPGEASARHHHPDNVVVFLSGGSIQNIADGGETTRSQPKAGDAVWRPALTHITKNVGDTPIEGVLVEPKHPHSSRPKDSADETTLPSARAKVLFENDRVRVLRYWFNPGEKVEMHSHPDNVQIALTDATAAITTPDGKVTHSQVKAGEVIWRSATVHSVQNIGDKPVEGVLVEMK